ncbi:hypothetical protein GCM10027570_26310 [Streptomonospora sediminis]
MTPSGENPYEPGHPGYSRQPEPGHPGQPGDPGSTGHPGQPGWSGPQQPPPHSYAASGPGSAPPAPGFFAALFDFEFRSFATTRIVKALFVLWLVLIGISTLSGMVGAFGQMAMNPLAGLLSLLGSLVGGAVAVLLTRVGLEVLVVLFRISEDLSAIRARR